MSHRSLSNKQQASAATTTTNQTTGITIAQKPEPGYIAACLNGSWLEVGNGVKTKDFYFSRDGGTTALFTRQVHIGDTLFWTKAREVYNLATTDLISLDYWTKGL